MQESLQEAIRAYFANNGGAFGSAVWRHVAVSAASLLTALLIAVPGGCVSVCHQGVRRVFVAVFQTLRIVPSLAVLLLLIPVLGTGVKPAVVALTLLAIPPILLNTIAGLDAVPVFVLETAGGLGMTSRQAWRRVRLPLALPMIVAGARIAVIEIIASATLASKIGAGGLGDIIFTGLGLARTDLLLVGGAAVAALSLLAGLVFTLLGKALFPYR